MAEPVRTTPRGQERASRAERRGERGISVLQRWIERPDGTFELRETPLTPEDFLDPQVGDKMVQGGEHSHVSIELYERIKRTLHARPDVLVFFDLKHLIGPRLGPAPDVSVIRGLDNPDYRIESFDIRTQGVSPCLIIEVVSPSDRRIREVDEKDKVKIYERIGVDEYLLVDLPRRRNGHRFRLWGYRLDDTGRYRPLEPDDQGRFLSATTGLLFQVSADGSRIELFHAATGQRILTSREEQQAREAAEQAREAAEQAREAEQQARQAAEQALTAEEQARRAAEAEVARLREELERLRRERGPGA